MRTRSVKIAVVCTLVGSVLAPSLGQFAAASPSAVAGPPSSPPPGPPSSPPGQQVDQGIELVDGLGNGGQPEGLPREVVIADARFLFDRIVPLSRQELFRVAQEQETIAYARTEEGPFAAIYLSVPNRSEDELARYLPEGVGSADVACPAEAGEYERVDASGSLYAFAGIETDLTADSLQQVGDSNGEPVSADPDSAQPFPELFFSSGGGLLRFVLVGDDGRPASIAESLAFNGTEFAFESDATDAVDPASLTKVGCSTAFPVFAPTDTVGGGFTQLYVLAGTRLLSFTGAGAAPADETTPPTTSTTSTTTTHHDDHDHAAADHDHAATDHDHAATDHDNGAADHDHEPPTTTTTPTTTTEPPTTTTTTATTTTEPPTTTSTSTTTTADGTADDDDDLDVHDDDEPPTTTSTSTDHDGAADDDLDVDDDDLDDHHHHDGGADDDARRQRRQRSRQQRPRRPRPRTTAAPTTTTIPAATCTGNPGELDAQGIPEHLPTPIQFGGVAYVFVRAEASEDVGTLTRIGCIGPFELASTDQADVDEVLYLRTTGAGADDQVYRFEAAPTFEIEFQVTERPQVISTGDQRYRVEQVWQPSVYSSTSVILFVEDPADPAPEVIYGLNVSDTVVGDAIGEYRLPDDSATTRGDDRRRRGGRTQPGSHDQRPDVHPGRRVHAQPARPATASSPCSRTPTEGTPEVLLGRDQREPDLLVFVLETSEPAS